MRAQFRERGARGVVDRDEGVVAGVRARDVARDGPRGGGHARRRATRRVATMTIDVAPTAANGGFKVAEASDATRDGEARAREGRRTDASDRDGDARDSRRTRARERVDYRALRAIVVGFGRRRTRGFGPIRERDALERQGGEYERDAEPLHDVERRTEHVAADEDAEELAERHDGG